LLEYPTTFNVSEKLSFGIGPVNKLFITTYTSKLVIFDIEGNVPLK
jgi:hypothetical protein